MKKTILLAITTTLVFASLSAFAGCPGKGTAKGDRTTLHSKDSKVKKPTQKPATVNR